MRLLLLILLCPLTVIWAAETTQPNIVFIFADDWGWGDLSCHGHPYVKTPHIDQLAKEGMDFSRFTVASPVCSPSRTAVMTGHFPARYNIDGHFAYVPSNAKRNMPDWLNLAAPSLPRFLQGAGYQTAHFGKWHLGNDMIPDSPIPGLYGYNTYGAFNCSGEQMPVHDDVRNAISFISKSVEQKKPFFINLWIHEPHTPFHTVPKYEWRFKHLEKREDQIYASVLSHADDRIGELLAHLDTLQLSSNTLVIFSSDNGPARAKEEKAPALVYDTATGAGWDTGASKGITAGRKGYKASLHEGGINVPFIVRWPGKVPAGKRDDTSLISAVDILPTLCAIAGVTLPNDYTPDGVEQTAVLMGNATTTRENPLFWRFSGTWPPPKNAPDHWASYVVVHKQWKFLQNKDGSHTELYDLQKDPLEKNTVHAANPDVIKECQHLLTQWLNSLPENPTGDVFSSLRKMIK